ncbi:unnamed protein product [Linum trigynum]|uniref:Uncharacterized protein n=1 Tax=Linum trigynum TaxID=586398 RepID=A0AAV2FSD5_9ROSI
MPPPRHSTHPSPLYISRPLNKPTLAARGPRTKPAQTSSDPPLQPTTSAGPNLHMGPNSWIAKPMSRPALAPVPICASHKATSPLRLRDAVPPKPSR